MFRRTKGLLKQQFFIDESISKLKLPGHLNRRLANHGIHTIQDLISKTSAEILEIPEIGPDYIIKIYFRLRINSFRLREVCYRCSKRFPGLGEKLCGKNCERKFDDKEGITYRKCPVCKKYISRARPKQEYHLECFRKSGYQQSEKTKKKLRQQRREELKNKTKKTERERMFW